MTVPANMAIMPSANIAARSIGHANHARTIAGNNAPNERGTEFQHRSWQLLDATDHRFNPLLTCLGMLTLWELYG